MGKGLQIGGILILAVSLAAGGQKENVRKAPAGPPPPKAMPKGFPKAPKKEGGGVRLNNPAHQFESLLSMSPDQRDRVIEKLPPQQQERLRARLDQFDKLPP